MGRAEPRKRHAMKQSNLANRKCTMGKSKEVYIIFIIERLEIVNKMNTNIEILEVGNLHFKQKERTELLLKIYMFDSEVVLSSMRCNKYLS